MSRIDCVRTQIRSTVSGQDRAVSPVIGVILMVAITVILAAVIGTFVLDLGQNVGQTGPTSSLGISDASDNFNPNSNTGQDMFLIEHQGGDELDLQNTRIAIRDTNDNTIIFTWNGSSGTDSTTITAEVNGNAATSGSSKILQTGDTIVIKEQSGSDATSVSDNQDHKIIISSTETDNTIAQATVKLQ